MKYKNSVELHGTLARDVQQKSTPSGVTIVNFSVYTEYEHKNGVSKSYTDCVAFGKGADDIIRKMLQKGDALVVVGRLQTRSWDDQETGKKRYKTEVVVENCASYDNNDLF